MPFSNTTFVSIAFDTGGVASGPMSAAFVLPLMIGFATSHGGASEGFGLIAIVSMMPILVLTILGVTYKAMNSVQTKKEYRRALQISYGLDVYSNIEKLEQEYLKIQREKEAEEKKQADEIERRVIEEQYNQLYLNKEKNGEEIKG